MAPLGALQYRAPSGVPIAPPIVLQTGLKIFQGHKQHAEHVAAEPQIVPLAKEVAGTGPAGFAGNILLGGLIGAGVDAYNGAAMDHKPNPVIVTLQPARLHLPPLPGRLRRAVSR